MRDKSWNNIFDNEKREKLINPQKDLSRIIEPFIPLNPLLDGIFRTTNWGLPDHINQTQGESLYSYDINSMYAAILAYLPLPGGTPVYFKEPELIKYSEFKRRLDKTELAFCWAYLKAPDKNLYIPYAMPQWSRNKSILQPVIQKDKTQTKLNIHWFQQLHEMKEWKDKEIKFQDPGRNTHNLLLFPKGEWYGAYHSFMLDFAEQLGYEIKIERGFIFKNINQTNHKVLIPWSNNIIKTPEEEINRYINPKLRYGPKPYFQEEIHKYYSYRFQRELPAYVTNTKLSNAKRIEIKRQIRSEDSREVKPNIWKDPLFLPLERFPKQISDINNTNIHYSESFLFHWLPITIDKNLDITTVPDIFERIETFNNKTKEINIDTTKWWNSQIYSRPLKTGRKKKEIKAKSQGKTEIDKTWITWKQSKESNSLSISMFDSEEELALGWTKNWNNIIKGRESKEELGNTINSLNNTHTEYINKSFYKEALALAHGFHGTIPRFSKYQAIKACWRQNQEEWAKYFLKKERSEIPPIFLLTYLSNPYFWEYKGPNSMILASAIYAHAWLTILKSLTIYNTKLYWNHKDTIITDKNYPIYTLKGDLGYFKNTRRDSEWEVEQDKRWNHLDLEATLYYENLSLTDETQIKWSQLRIQELDKWEQKWVWRPRRKIETLNDKKEFPIFNYRLFNDQFSNNTWNNRGERGKHVYRIEWPKQKRLTEMRLLGEKDLHPWSLRYPMKWPSMTQIFYNRREEMEEILPFLPEEEIIDINWLLDSLSPYYIKKLLGITQIEYSERDE